MKHFKKLMIALTLTLSFLRINAQEVKVAEPEFTANIIYVDGTEGRPLEKQKAMTQKKAGASMFIVGIGKVKSKHVVNGASSPLRIHQRDSIMFIVKVFDQSADPAQTINVFKLEQNVKKDSRAIEISSAGTFSGFSTTDIQYIPFVAKKYRKKSFLVRISRPLEPGEYAITVSGHILTFNMFGVD